MHTKDNIEVTWPDRFWNKFQWQETLMTDGIPKDDVWDTPARQKILALEEMYKKINLSPEATKHYMSIRPPLPQQVQSIIDRYQTIDSNYNFLKLTAGHNIVKHYDSYATFIKFNNIAEEMNEEDEVIEEEEDPHHDELSDEEYEKDRKATMKRQRKKMYGPTGHDKTRPLSPQNPFYLKEKKK